MQINKTNPSQSFGAGVHYSQWMSDYIKSAPKKQQDSANKSIRKLEKFANKKGLDINIEIGRKTGTVFVNCSKENSDLSKSLKVGHTDPHSGHGFYQVLSRVYSKVVDSFSSNAIEKFWYR